MKKSKYPEKMVRVEWVDSTIATSSQTAEEYNAFATLATDMAQVSIGILTHDLETHICLACMMAPEGNVGTAIKIPKFAVVKIEELVVK